MLFPRWQSTTKIPLVKARRLSRMVRRLSLLVLVLRMSVVPYMIRRYLLARFSKEKLPLLLRRKVVRRGRLLMSTLLACYCKKLRSFRKSKVLKSLRRSVITVV